MRMRRQVFESGGCLIPQYSRGDETN
jgi:hypothetical protein